MGGDHYTQVHNHVFRDTRLTPTAVAVFGYLSTHSQGWETSAAGIARDRQIGPSAVKAALAVLKKYHYVVWGQERNEDGVLGKGWYFITDLPAQLAALGIEDAAQVQAAVEDALTGWLDTNNRRSEPVSSERPQPQPAETRPVRVYPKSLLKDNRRSEAVSERRPRSEPVSSEPLAVPAAGGGSDHKEEQRFKEDHSTAEGQRTTNTSARERTGDAERVDESLFEAPDPKPRARPTDRELTEGFDEFYCSAYPRKKAPQAARKAWVAARRRGVSAEHMISAARRYALETQHRDREKIKYPASWLNAGSYDDEPDRPQLVRPARSTTDQRMDDIDALVARRLARKNGVYVVPDTREIEAM